MDIRGFDLVDINQCLFIYIQATNYGLQFTDTSKLQITSCELIRWFDESTIAAPSGFATVSMIDLQDNNLASFGAVNISGCIIHPQQNQNGIDIGTGSTTGFGTISSNAFVDGNLLGEVFLPVVSPGLPDYSSTATAGYDVFANQGVLNSTSGIIWTMLSNNTQTNTLPTGTPVIMAVNGSLPVQQGAVRYDLNTSTGRVTYTGSKQVYVSIHVTITYIKQGGGGSDLYTFEFYKNGTLLPGSGTSADAPSADPQNLTVTYGVLMNQNDYIEIYITNNNGVDAILVRDLQFLIRE